MAFKRRLTEEEIKDILSFIKPLPGLPFETAQSVADSHYESHAKQLRAVQLCPEKIPELKLRLQRLYDKAQIEAGKSAGACSSTSTGEKNTQNSLSSFHTSGQSKVELLVGVPRFEEILNVTRDIKTPCMEVHLAFPQEKLKNLAFVREQAQQLFEYKELVEFLLDYDIAEDRVITAEEEAWYGFYKTFYNTDFEDCRWSVRLILNVTLLYSYRKSLSNLADIIQNIYADAFCVFSPDNLGIIDVYVKTDEIGDVKTIIRSIKSTRKKSKPSKSGEEEEDTKDSKKDKDSKEGGKDSKKKSKAKKEDEELDADLAILITEENKEYYFLRDLVVPSLYYIPIGGIKGIKKCFYQENKDKTWCITTKGSNLKAIIRHPLVNPEKTTSNHLWDNYEVFGIEATRLYLQKEMYKLLSISTRHLDLLIDCMTHSGRPQAVSRYGIDKHQVGIWAKVAFEQPFDNFLDAATIAEKESSGGASFAITFGNAPSMGSGFFGLLDKKGGKLIDTEQDVHNAHQKFLATLKAEPNSYVKPDHNRMNIIRAAERLVDEGTVNVSTSMTSSNNAPRKSTFNTKVRPTLYAPNMPTYIQESRKPTVTRIRLNNPAEQAEMVQVANPPPTVFNNEEVAEHTVEMY
jgi:DNA-directed RNA polymerase beta' subunit